jgi:tetratricopeptide (TPR) repeat protein
MAALRDANGLGISTSSAAARACVDAAMLHLHAGSGEVHTWIDGALRHDPQCASACCIDTAASLLAAEHVGDRALLMSLARFDETLEHANDRERRHAAAAHAWQGGDFARALDTYDRLLKDYPRDSLALQLAHALDFRLGNREMLRDRIANVLPAWDPTMPAFGHVLAMYAFGLEECGDYAAAESTAQRSLGLVPNNAAAIHVIAHVMEMQGRAREGIEWLQRLRGEWSRNAAFGVHLAWHLALFHLDNDEPGAALSIYDDALAPGSSMAALVDASALLWRLDLRGVRVQRRARRVARHWTRKRLSGVRAFNLVHATAAFAAARRHRPASRVIRLLRDDPATRRVNRQTDLALAIPVCEAMLAFSRGDYAMAVNKMNIVRAIALNCGGSVAQCDLIHLTLLEAALRSRRMPLAHALAAERAARKPRSLLNRWLFARAATAA